MTLVSDAPEMAPEMKTMIVATRIHIVESLPYLANEARDMGDLKTPSSVWPETTRDLYIWHELFDSVLAADNAS